MFRSEVFLSCRAIRILLDVVLLSGDTNSQDKEFGLKKATELREGAVEGVVLVSDGLDNPE